MKISPLLFFILSLSFATHASEHAAQRRSNGLLKFIVEQEGLRDFGLFSLIGTRCARYLPREQKDNCKKAVRKMITNLDYDVIIADDKMKPRLTNAWGPSSFVFVAFKNNLITLLNSPKTSVYLRSLNENLYKYLTNEIKELNVWDFTKEHYKDDFTTSLVIAALFQDTSIMKLHLAYLEYSQTAGTSSFSKNKEYLGRVIDTINLILDSSEEHYRELFYPQAIQKDLNRNIYHFYVPLFLAKSLERDGFSKDEASSAALMLTLTYEFITSSQDYRYLYSDPKTITLTGKLKDIFGGYCGSNIGVRGMDFNKSFEVLRASFERSTEGAVELLLRH
jgi:hypothetical protein